MIAKTTCTDVVGVMIPMVMAIGLVPATIRIRKWYKVTVALGDVVMSKIRK